MNEALRRAQRKYDKEHVRRFMVKFYPKDESLYFHLHEQENMNLYIQNLIREDMNRKKRKK